MTEAEAAEYLALPLPGQVGYLAQLAVKYGFGIEWQILA